MPVRLKTEGEEGTIGAADLAQGQLAVLVSIDAGRHCGAVVMRTYDDALVSLRDGDRWSNVKNVASFRVRILPPGTLLEIV